jgi:putative transposase
MAEAISPASGRRYGVARVCRVWAVPCSSFHATRKPKPDSATQRPPARRGPEPAVSDEALLAAIRADLRRSPWTGEGHRKVWARLRTLDGIRVSRKRVLRLMRGHALLSPHRARRRTEAAHHRRIVTEAPNVMWPADATQITTVQDGKVWLFGVAEHWNAELLGWHVARRGTRFEAIQALGMAVRQQFGHLSAGAARGLALRHDHGSNFMADDFQKQAKFWGVSPSYAFVGEPETNGVIERLFRTLKEQAVHGRIFQTIEEVRDAVRAFVARYNAEWLIEKNGQRSPLDMRSTCAPHRRSKPSSAPRSATHCPRNRVRYRRKTRGTRMSSRPRR